MDYEYELDIIVIYTPATSGEHARGWKRRVMLSVVLFVLLNECGRLSVKTEGLRKS